MASAMPDPAERPCQQWLDIARPIQPRLPRDRPAPARAPRRPDDVLAARQMELRMTAPAPSAAPPAMAAPVIAPKAESRAEVTAPPAAPVTPPPPSFVKWLLAQNKSGGAVGELAKAARLDPLFPKDGNADAVRARFNQAGADGDAFAALDDAERAYDRLA
ncbi:hypothetical protein [Sphingomonas crusticola]|uniref:hypothetical protein n=1 Tax=Sphingomonas crusticola TaxID=1697973 RepID=UPI001F085FBD|nr:hypothetical protein [Sphingomonas crusticola]